MMYYRSVQVTINLQQENANPEKTRSNTYHFSGGLVEYVLWLNHDKVCFIDYLSRVSNCEYQFVIEQT